MELDISRINESSRIVDIRPSFEVWNIEEYEQIEKYFEEKLKKGEMSKTKVGYFNKTSLYVGEKNKEGKYHGIGRLLFNYNSWPEYYYIGEFVDGIEEGNGIYISRRLFKGLNFQSYASVMREKGVLKRVNFMVNGNKFRLTDNNLYYKIDNLEVTGLCDPEILLYKYLGCINNLPYLKDKFPYFKQVKIVKGEYKRKNHYTLFKKKENFTEVEYRFNDKTFFKGFFQESLNIFLMNENPPFSFEYGLTFRMNNPIKYKMYGYLLTGYCKLYTPNKGIIYEGTFKNGTKDGKGIEYDKEVSKEVYYKLGYRMTSE